MEDDDLNAQSQDSRLVRYLPEVVSDAVASAVRSMDLAAGEGLCVLLAEESKDQMEELVACLNGLDIMFFGGLFPGLLHTGQRHHEGVVLLALPLVGKPHVFRSDSGQEIEMEEPAPPLTFSGEAAVTALVLVDGLSAGITSTLEELFGRLGNTVHYFGGGAGSLSLEQQPCLFTNEGIFQDQAIVAFVRLASRLGVRHGWNRLMGPVIATRTRKNIVEELNWKNAFEIYAQTVSADSGREISSENFFDIAKGYPFGMIHEGAEDIVRDPIAVTPEGYLICVGDVPENSVLSILKGTPESLVSAAGDAAEHAAEGDGENCRLCFVADCISRAIFLEEGFSDELGAIRAHLETGSAHYPCAGMLTLGEISSHGDGLVEFLNKTAVVGMLYEP